MRPMPRIVVLKAAGYGGEGIVDTSSPAPVSVITSVPPTSACVTHACRWWPYMSGSKELKANTAMVIIILLSVLTLAVGLKSLLRRLLRPTHILELDVDNEQQQHDVNNTRHGNNSDHDELVEVVDMKKTSVGPMVVYSAAEMKAAECAICLSEFVEGDVMRVLEGCKHGFHSHCIQAWLSASSHASCPTCRSACLPPPPQSGQVGPPASSESVAPS